MQLSLISWMQHCRATDKQTELPKISGVWSQAAIGASLMKQNHSPEQLPSSSRLQRVLALIPGNGCTASTSPQERQTTIAFLRLQNLYSAASTSRRAPEREILRPARSVAPVVLPAAAVPRPVPVPMPLSATPQTPHVLQAGWCFKLWLNMNGTKSWFQYPLHLCCEFAWGCLKLGSQL